MAQKVMDGNTAASSIAYKMSEVAAIYPITPSSNMGENADAWAASGVKNLFGQEVDVIEMQSEGGAAGAIHGSLTAGALSTTFTSSQGLLLMIPNMHKIAGEMLPTVFHVAARSLAAQSLSIFADHSDVMGVRNTGYAIVAAADPQEVQDLAIISHCATVESRVPFLNFFDGFRTSHEIHKIEEVPDSVMLELYNQEAIKEFKQRSLSPEHPMCKVGAQNPDVYFQGRETVNKYYDETPGIVKKYMHLFGEKTGRYYQPFEYVGSPTAEKVLIAMASSTNTLHEVVEYLNKRGDNVGVLKVRLYRPFSVEDFLSVIPPTVKKIAVLDRTKEPGSIGEPLYLDVVAALKDRRDITIIGGRYGLSSKEFTPTMAKSVFDHLDNKCSHDFVVGIEDDITHKSTVVYEEIDSESPQDIKCKFWGYGSDGTVSANKNSIHIIGENTENYVQGYFSYDSHKAGGVTVSHVRFGKNRIRSEYLLTKANFIALHKPSYIGRYDILEGIEENGTFLLNAPWSPDEAFEKLTKEMQEQILQKNVRFYIIDATKIAKETGLKNRINTVMQAAFFKLAKILPEQEAIELMKRAVEKQFSRKGKEIVEMNWKAIDKSSDEVKEVTNKTAQTSAPNHNHVPNNADEWACQVINPIVKLKGDSIPVSKMPLDAAIPTGTTKYEKRGIANSVPHWLPDKCIQCGICAFVCPHAVIRTKQIEQEDLKSAPESFRTIPAKVKNDRDLQYSVQISPEDCTGCTNCGNCVDECPVQALVAIPIEDSRAQGENENWNYFSELPDVTEGSTIGTVKGSQLVTPLFEFSGACAGCGETPYIKLATQLFGERMIIANATGCSSIYGGTFPNIPYTKTPEGKGPAWANSLFEDNAEYGFGFRLAIDANRRELKTALEQVLKTGTTHEMRGAVENMLKVWKNTGQEAKDAAKEVLTHLPHARNVSFGESAPILWRIDELKDYLVDKSVWIIGGDGWAYDIGFGGLDHVLASGRNVNVLVLDTEVYSNTGGQKSKATPRGATAKFAVAGKRERKKDLGRMMMTYGDVYVASVSYGANMQHLVKVFQEAESFNGPSIIIAYSPCVAHGIDMRHSAKESKLAVDTGYWPLYRFDPRLLEQGKEPLQIDHAKTKAEYNAFLDNEIRYTALKNQHPEVAKELFSKAQKDAEYAREQLRSLAHINLPPKTQEEQAATPLPEAGRIKLARVGTGTPNENEHDEEQKEESFSDKVVIDYTKCDVSEECVKVCPTDVFEKQGDKVVVARPQDCTTCRACEELCPSHAIRVKD